MKKKKLRPWLTSAEMQVSDDELKKMSESWTQETWESYLSWFETSMRERLEAPDLYDELADQTSATAFDGLSSTDDSVRRLCEEMLATLSPKEQGVLRKTYLEGKTVRQIATESQASKTGTQHAKLRALRRLQRGQHRDKWYARHLMRGASVCIVPKVESVWTRASSHPPKEDKVYEPSRQREALESIKLVNLREAIHALSERQKRIIFLRFWCDYSISDIARDLRCGSNLIEQVMDATISRLKRTVTDLETTRQSDGGPSCA